MRNVVFYIKWCVLTKKCCHGVSQALLGMEYGQKGLNTLFMSIVLIESAIQMLIEPIFVRHCPKYWNGYNVKSQIAISLKPLCKPL